jgi:hypothetical protein
MNIGSTIWSFDLGKAFIGEAVCSFRRQLKGMQK